jgi:hypothetical protein
LCLVGRAVGGGAGVWRTRTHVPCTRSGASCRREYPSQVTSGVGRPDAGKRRGPPPGSVSERRSLRGRWSRACWSGRQDSEVTCWVARRSWAHGHYPVRSKPTHAHSVLSPCGCRARYPLSSYLSPMEGRCRAVEKPSRSAAIPSPGQSSRQLDLGVPGPAVPPPGGGGLWPNVVAHS